MALIPFHIVLGTYRISGKFLAPLQSQNYNKTKYHSTNRRFIMLKGLNKEMYGNNFLNVRKIFLYAS